MLTVQSLYWVGGATGAPTTWDTSSQNWSTTSGGSANAMWTNGDQAIFGGTATTINVASGISADSIKFTAGGYILSGSNSLTVSGTHTIDVASGLADTISTTLNCSGGMTKTSSGTLTLGGSNSYSGTTTVSAGTLAAGSTGAFSSNSAFTVNSTLDLHGFDETISSLSSTSTSGLVSSLVSGTAILTEGSSGASSNFSGNIQDGSGGAGHVGLTKAGTGTLYLSGNNAYSGDTTVSGTLKAGSNTAFSSGSNYQLQSGGKLDLNGYSANIGSLSSSNSNGSVTNSGIGYGYGYGSNGYGYYPTPIAATLTEGSNNASSTFTGVIQDGYVSGYGNGYGTFYPQTGLIKTGSGALTLTGANTYTLGTTLSGGTLNLGSAETVGSSGPLGASSSSNHGNIVFSGGTLQYSSVNHNDYSGRFSTAANQSVSIDTNGQNVTFATALTSSGGTLNKLGAGTLTLSAANTYTGVTTL
ncbi:MAG TPA: autotransporter-associated beta strand repeat-containing protein, partial [Pirellulales bacterium]|nr:autotransporter-associated beta strand repeat-containing protein [Pirellulales bacterium]